MPRVNAKNDNALSIGAYHGLIVATDADKAPIMTPIKAKLESFAALRFTTEYRVILS